MLASSAQCSKNQRGKWKELEKWTISERASEKKIKGCEKRASRVLQLLCPPSRLQSRLRLGGSVAQLRKEIARKIRGYT